MAFRSAEHKDRFMAFGRHVAGGVGGVVSAVVERMNFNLMRKISLWLCGAVFGMCGCAATTTVPAYNLPAQQDKKTLIFVETPARVGADADLAEQLTKAIQKQLVSKAGIKPANVLIADATERQSTLSPQQAAQTRQAGLVLYVLVEEYELTQLPIRSPECYAGRLVSRAALIDAVGGQMLWPEGNVGKQIEIVLELNKGSRQATLDRLVSSAAHCIARDLYPIEKRLYRNSDQRLSADEAFEMDIF